MHLGVTFFETCNNTSWKFGHLEPLLGCRELLDRESNFGQDEKKNPKAFKCFNFGLVTMQIQNLGILSFGMLKINYPIGVL